MTTSNRRERKHIVNNKRIFSSLLILLFLAATPVPVHASFQQPPPCKNSFTPDKEIAEGKKAAQQVYKTMPVLPDSSSVTQYIQRLGAKLVQYAPASSTGTQWPYEFHVVNQVDINAFALPGGPVFVNLGTIQAAETEAQLAGVMAHEISHVVMRHATCNITKQQSQAPLWAIGQLAAGVIGGQLAAQGVGAAAGMTFLKMGRDAERQADLMGTNIAYDAGYDPRGMVQFFEIIQGKYGAGGTQFLSDHPNPGNRTEYVNAEIATLAPRSNWVKTTPEFEKIKKIVSGMHAYTAKQISSGEWKTGASNVSSDGSNNETSNGPNNLTAQPVDFKASGDWQLLDSTGFSVQYPGNWQASQRMDGATIAPQNGVSTTNGNSTIVYGVMVDAYRPDQAADLATSTNQLVSAMQKENPGMKSVTNIEDVRVNQQPGKSVEFVNQGQSERDWMVAITRKDGSLSYLVFVAPQKDFEALRPTYEQMLRTFRIK